METRGNDHVKAKIPLSIDMGPQRTPREDPWDIKRARVISCEYHRNPGRHAGTWDATGLYSGSQGIPWGPLACHGSVRDLHAARHWAPLQRMG